jgi:hypothetical protein
MNLIRRLAIPAVAAVAVLAGTAGSAAALAATSPAPAKSAVEAPVAAHLAVAERAATADSPNVSASYHWFNQGEFGTAKACKSAGDYILSHVNSGYIFSCVGMNGGEYVYYILWVGVPS